MRAKETLVIVSHFVVQRAHLIVSYDCRTPAVVSIFTDSAAFVLSFYHSTPLHYYYYLFINKSSFSPHMHGKSYHSRLGSCCVHVNVFRGLINPLCLLGFCVAVTGSGLQIYLEK